MAIELRKAKWWWLAGVVTTVHLVLLDRLPVHLLGESETTVVRLNTRKVEPQGTAAQASSNVKPHAPPKPIATEAPATAAQESSQMPTPVVAETPSDPPVVNQQSLATSTTKNETVTPDAVSSKAPEMPPATVPDSMTLKYDVQGQAKGFTYSASAELSFQRDATQYDARLTVGAFLLGSRVDSSRGMIGSQGLIPVRYAQKTRAERAAHFDRENHRITFSNNRPDAHLLPGAQDRLSVVLQLSALLAAQPQQYGPGKVITLQVANADSAEPWSFIVHGLETVMLPAGEMAAVKVDRQHVGEYAQKVELWFSPSMDWLPVRMRIANSGGDVVDQLLRNAQR